MRFPTNVCVLDLETSKTKLGFPEKCEIAFVGIRCYRYSRKGRRYYPLHYQAYCPEELAELERMLNAFDGVILGHNIFAFDYRVLWKRISLDGIVDKTVDTLHYLFGRNGKRYFGLSLNYLALDNFGERKQITGKMITRLWQKGRRERVISSNKDSCCRLTQRLWFRLVTRGCVSCQRGYGWLDVKPGDLPRLLGKKPMFTYGRWLRRFGLNRPPITASRGKLPKTKASLKRCKMCGSKILTAVDAYLQDPSDGEYSDCIAGYPQVLECDKCGATMTFSGDIVTAS